MRESAPAEPEFGFSASRLRLETLQSWELLIMLLLSLTPWHLVCPDNRDQSGIFLDNKVTPFFAITYSYKLVNICLKMIVVHLSDSTDDWWMTEYCPLSGLKRYGKVVGISRHTSEFFWLSIERNWNRCYPTESCLFPI